MGVFQQPASSRAYGRGHESIFGLIGGMVIMALSLLLMQ